MADKFFVEIKIPEGVDIEVSDNLITVKGKNGEIKREFRNPRLYFIIKDGNFKIIIKDDIKYKTSDKVFANTYLAHVKNMIRGVQDKYTAKLKICSGHFPMQVSITGNILQIKNFLGEKVPRKTRLIEGVKVDIQGEFIDLVGIDKDSVGQMAADIEQSTRITNRDRRIFQDGIYIIKKPGDEK